MHYLHYIMRQNAFSKKCSQNMHYNDIKSLRMSNVSISKVFPHVMCNLHLFQTIVIPIWSYIFAFLLYLSNVINDISLLSVTSFCKWSKFYIERKILFVLNWKYHCNIIKQIANVDAVLKYLRSIFLNKTKFELTLSSHQ